MSALDWLRRRLGESAELAAVRADLTEVQRQQAVTVQALLARTAERDAAAEVLRKADAAVARAYEPATGEDCTKVRLRDQDEAVAYAVRVEQDLCLPAGAMHAYPCRKCPRQPVAGTRYWHVGNTEAAQRTGRNPAMRRQEQARRAKQRAQDGQLMRQRLNPEVVARLRDAGRSAS